MISHLHPFTLRRNCNLHRATISDLRQPSNLGRLISTSLRRSFGLFFRSPSSATDCGSLHLSSSSPDTWTEKLESFERINSMRETNGNFDSCNSCKRLEPAVYMSCMSQNFRLFHVSNLSVRNFRFFSAHVSGIIEPRCGAAGGGGGRACFSTGVRSLLPLVPTSRPLARSVTWRRQLLPAGHRPPAERSHATAQQRPGRYRPAAEKTRSKSRANRPSGEWLPRFLQRGNNWEWLAPASGCVEYDGSFWELS